jgi:hypothetical protein
MPTTFSQTLVNPGGELGNTTGWITDSGAAVAVSTGSTHSGTYKLGGSNTSRNSTWHQDLIVPGARQSAIDNGATTISLKAWHLDTSNPGFWQYVGHLFVTFLSSENANLGSVALADSAPSAWTQDSISTAVPSGTRTIRFGTINTQTLGPSGLGVYWDDFTLDLVEDVPIYAANSQDKQTVAYVLGSQPAAQVRDNQSVSYAVSAGETSTGLPTKVHQFVAYALVQGIADRRDLRAWTFTQDDHDFYVLQLGDTNTLVYDKATKQWVQWKSPAVSYWRGNDGCAWQGINLCCDSLSGKLFKIDPTGRLDYGTTPITSVVVGGITERFRSNIPCYMAELAVSEGLPPTGIDATRVGISLRSGDGRTWIDHGSVTGTILGDSITVRWYGLGLMSKPGKIFEITDTGYARRIDGLNIELGSYDKSD